jgi:hypothetical protein
MAKGQVRQAKEKKKPKAAGDKPKHVSSYKLSLQSGSGSSSMSAPKK